MVSKDDVCYYLFIVLLTLIVGGLLAWCVFKSDGSLSVKRTGPGSSELTPPMPRLQLLIHDLRRDTAGPIVWRVVIGWGGGQPGIWRQRSLSSVIGHSGILISILRTRNLLGIITPCQVQMWGIDHVFIVIASMEIGAGLVAGIMVKAITREGWRSIAANRAGVWECRLVGQLLTRWAVVRCIRVFRVAVLRSSVVSIVWKRRSLW